MTAEMTTHSLSPDRREAIRGGCGKNLLFFTLRKTNIDPLRVRNAPQCLVLHSASRLVTEKDGVHWA
jgi:hypothetical protein